MATANGLRGGLNGKDNGSALEEAKKRLPIMGKEIDLSRLLKKPAEDKPAEDRRMSGEELAKYVNTIADGVFEFVLRARRFLRQLDKDIQEIGSEVRFDICEDGDDTRQQRADEYETTIPALVEYAPERDRVLRKEADNPGRRQFVEALCLRVSACARIGLLADDLRNAENKDSLERLLEESKDNGNRVFENSSAKNATVWAFGKGYGVAKVFGERYHNLANKTLAEVANARAKELATAHKTETEKRKQEVLAYSDSLLTAEELIFGNTDGMSVLSWKFQGYDNVIRVRRSGTRLYIVDAVGSPLSALETMEEECKEPFIVLRHILAEDGDHLCPGKMIDDRPRYKFHDTVARQAFQMTLWVRTAAGASCPNRLLPEDETRAMFSVANDKKPNGNKKRPVKIGGEFLTDQEFLFHRGLGEYRLVYEAGFHFEPRDENNEPTGATFQITANATALVERKEADGKDKIALKLVSTDELAQLLLAGGAEAGHEFFEGQKGAGLPAPLYLGIGQAFRRLKMNEG